MCLSNASLPRTWNAPGISHSTSSVRHGRISYGRFSSSRPCTCRPSPCSASCLTSTTVCRGGERTIIQTCVTSRDTHSTQRIQYPRFAVGALIDHHAAWFGGILPRGGDSIACAAPSAYPVSAPVRRPPWPGIENRTMGPPTTSRRSAAGPGRTDVGTSARPQRQTCESPGDTPRDACPKQDEKCPARSGGGA